MTVAQLVIYGRDFDVLRPKSLLAYREQLSRRAA